MTPQTLLDNLRSLYASQPYTYGQVIRSMPGWTEPIQDGETTKLLAMLTILGGINGRRKIW
jgi:hypothetical protein